MSAHLNFRWLIATRFRIRLDDTIPCQASSGRRGSPAGMPDEQFYMDMFKDALCIQAEGYKHVMEYTVRSLSRVKKS